MENIDFMKITPCGECCVGCEKKKLDYVKDVSNPMAIAKNGQNWAVARFLSVRNSTAFSFAGYARYFPASFWLRKSHGILI